MTAMPNLNDCYHKYKADFSAFKTYIALHHPILITKKKRHEFGRHAFSI